MRKKLRLWAIELALIFALILFMRSCQTDSHPRGPAPRANVETLSGQRLTLGAPGPEPLIIHFWATWCGVCRAEESNISALSGSGQVITIASSSGSPAAVRQYMQSHHLTFPVIVDTNDALAARYGVRAFPTTFFVERSGAIKTSEVGYTTYLGLKLRLWLAGW